MEYIRLTHKTAIPFVNLYTTPHTLGVDRIALVGGAVSHYPNKNILVIDAGTCVTYDFVNNNAEVKVTLTGLGSYGEFPIDILNFGHLYWVSAQEYDPIQYFKTIEDAIECAEFEYDSFLNGSLDEN